MLTLLSFIIIIGGPLLLMLFVLELRKAIYFTLHSVRTTGKITHIEWRDAHRRNKVAYPTIKFKTESGKVVTHTSEVGLRPYTEKVGNTVPVRYLRTAPEQAVIDRISSRWAPVLLLGLVSVPMTLMAVNLFNTCASREFAACVATWPGITP
jgi:hypothetical protein